MTTLGPEDLDLVRRRVVNVIGHELRTPLTTVRGLADLLADAPEDELRGTLIPALVRNARRAERLLDDLLVAAGVDTARPTASAEAMDLGALVGEAIEDADASLVGAPPPPALGHPAQISRAVDHLLDNARQYGDAAPTVGFESDDDTVTVVVRTPVEHPPTPAELELGFELFFRGEHAVTRAAGLGIGLPVARALARSEGGDVTIAEEDHVVVTRLTLPRA